MKKALMPFAIIFAVLAVLMAFVWWYERTFGMDGSFGMHHSHGHDKPAEETVMPK